MSKMAKRMSFCKVSLEMKNVDIKSLVFDASDVNPPIIPVKPPNIIIRQHKSTTTATILTSNVAVDTLAHLLIHSSLQGPPLY